MTTRNRKKKPMAVKAWAMYDAEDGHIFIENSEPFITTQRPEKTKISIFRKWVEVEIRPLKSRRRGR